MTFIRYKYIPIFVFFCLLIIVFLPVYSQSLLQNPASVNVDSLTDAQINQFLQQAQAAGLSDADLIAQAQAKGMSAEQIQKLQSRIQGLRNVKTATTGGSSGSTPSSSARIVTGAENGDAGTVATGKSRIFGADLFRNSNTSFEPNLRIATPVNYILGPDDEVDVNVYGNSLVSWKLSVSPEGNINIPGVGILNVSGKTIEQATAGIKAKLSASNYAIGRGTSVQVTLGNIRSIKVIVNGQVVKPGTITVPSLATVFNALYACGGPNDNGSFRDIEIIRGNKIIRHLDVYDFLLKGDQKDNIRLEDQDIIRVPTYKVRVDLTGEVKTPALFEVLPGESLKDVIRFAGGFTDLAYTDKIKVFQISGQERRITDVSESDYQSYTPLRGDRYVVDKILDRYQNRITISGAVFRPGQFELSKGLTLSQLITKAGGLKEDAFENGYVTRLNPDNTLGSISFNTKAIMNNTAADISLQREDVIRIASVFDLRDKYIVSIKGEVRQPGNFQYADSMTVQNLIIKAGGFSEGASPKRLEVSRRITNGDPSSSSSNIAQVFSVNINSNLSSDSARFVLKPFDVVSVYSLPGYEVPRTVKIEGEVIYPGYYTIKTKNERISDLITRAGGITASADIEGARLKRTEHLGIDLNKSTVDVNEVKQERVDRLEHIQKTLKDSTNNVYEQLKNDYVGIDLKAIMKNPGSPEDVLLEEGDVLRIPKQQQLVKVNGEVLFPSSVVYTNSKSLGDFVSNAGGFSPNALKRRAYVVYANGAVESTRSFLFIKSYPKVKPGSEIVIPKKPESKGISATEVGSITAALASAAAVLIGVISISRK